METGRKEKKNNSKGVKDDADDADEVLEVWSSDCMSREAAPVEKRHEQSSRERQDAQRGTLQDPWVIVCLFASFSVCFVLRRQHLDVPSLKKKKKTTAVETKINL